jgi:nucleolar protein 8
MVFRYENGLWKDSHGEIVESIRQGEPAEDAMEQVEIGSGDERQMNISVLESLFSKDIKPMPKVSISDDEHDRDEGSDINEEIELVIDDREGSNNIVQFSNTDDAAAPRPFTDVDWDEDDVEEAGHKDAPPGAALVNDTSTLRSLFNPPEESNSFRLFRGEDESSDIDEAELPDNEVMAPILRPVTVEEVPLVTQRGSVGLFFGHFESPFLYSQTQAAKMDAGVFDRNKWEEQFWTSRGDWNRELRKRRRDVSRQQRKRAMARSHRAAG